VEDQDWAGVNNAKRNRDRRTWQDWAGVNNAKRNRDRRTWYGGFESQPPHHPSKIKLRLGELVQRRAALQKFERN